MSKKKSNEKPMLTGYEHDAMWMSYRYAIGRHTAAATMHAGNMIQNVYGRLPKDQAEFDAYDIRREIAYHLQWEFDFDMNILIPREYYDPFKALIEFEKTLPKCENALINSLRIHRIAVYLNDKNEYIFEKHEPIHTNDLQISGFRDLLVWANAANALDPNKHHMITIEHDGKIETIEAFEYYRINPNLKEDTFSCEYASIDNYVANPFEFTYISGEFITKIDDKEP